jgi:Voltage gated chloride channel
VRARHRVLVRSSCMCTLCVYVPFMCVLCAFLLCVHVQRLEVLMCACAAGVAASFGSAFGATLFSVEVSHAAIYICVSIMLTLVLNLHGSMCTNAACFRCML